jgi:hypothetical protein
MPSLISFLIFVCVCAAVLGGIAAFISRLSQAPHPKIAPDWEPPKSDPLPYAKRKYFFSAAEHLFYESLKAAVMPNHVLFAKVRLADVVYIKRGTGSWQSYFNRISAKHLDFLLCDKNLLPVVAIELDDSSHDEEKRQIRDGFVDQVLNAAALPILRVRAKHAYEPADLRQMLLPYVQTQRL